MAFNGNAACNAAEGVEKWGDHVRNRIVVGGRVSADRLCASDALRRPAAARRLWRDHARFRVVKQFPDQTSFIDRASILIGNDDDRTTGMGTRLWSAFSNLAEH
jgi:hypothetical protein